MHFCPLQRPGPNSPRDRDRDSDPERQRLARPAARPRRHPFMHPSTNAELLKSRIRTVRDWPKPGINFRDVTTLFHDPEAFRVMIEAFAQDATRLRADLIAAVDARGLCGWMRLLWWLCLLRCWTCESPAFSVSGFVVLICRVNVSR